MKNQANKNKLNISEMHMEQESDCIFVFCPSGDFTCALEEQKWIPENPKVKMRQNTNSSLKKVIDLIYNQLKELITA